MPQEFFTLPISEREDLKKAASSIIQRLSSQRRLGLGDMMRFASAPVSEIQNQIDSLPEQVCREVIDLISELPSVKKRFGQA